MLFVPPIIPTPDGPMVEGSSPELLRRLLTEVDRELEVVGIDLDVWFQPGLSPATITAQLQPLGLQSPELSEWFGWRNGYRRNSLPPEEPPLPNFLMGTLDDAVARYRNARAFVPPRSMQLGMEATDFDFEVGAGEGWLLLGGATEGLALEATGNAVPRIRYANADFEYAPDGMFRAVSLCTYVTWWLIGLRNGGYTWHPGLGIWIMDAENLARSRVDARFW